MRFLIDPPVDGTSELRATVEDAGLGLFRAVVEGPFRLDVTGYTMSDLAANIPLGVEAVFAAKGHAVTVRPAPAEGETE